MGVEAARGMSTRVKGEMLVVGLLVRVGDRRGRRRSGLRRL